MNKYIRNPLNEKELLSLEGAYEVIVNLKQSLNEIREIESRYDFENYSYFKERLVKDHNTILQIIDKGLGDEKNGKLQEHFDRE